MAKIEIVLPAMGEGIIEASITKWLVKEGDHVEEDQPLLEVATDKVDSEIPSPVKGIVAKIVMAAGETPAIGSLLAIIETGSEPPQSDPREVDLEVERIRGASGQKPREHAPGGGIQQQGTPEPQEFSTTGHDRVPETKQSDDSAPYYKHSGEIPRQTPSGKFLTPLVRSIAKKESISAAELDSISGTGESGRITKNDLVKYLDVKNKTGRHGDMQPVEVTGVQEKGTEGTAESGAEKSFTGHTKLRRPLPGEGDRIVEMDRVRKIIAGHMVASKQISPHVTSFIDVDVSELVSWRDSNKAGFMDREKEKITYTPLFVEAVAKALQDFPMVNVSVDGTSIIIRKNINIGIAVALSDGNLVVPVIKNADEKSLVGIVRAVNDLANRARNNKLQPSETTGGTFTITNFGTFRNTTGTPIINQPEAAILGVGAIKKKPVVIEAPIGDVIAIRHIMTLSLSYDHRVIDGALGGMFLERIASYMENFDLQRKI